MKVGHDDIKSNILVCYGHFGLHVRSGPYRHIVSGNMCGQKSEVRVNHPTRRIL
jgi:hypothetical protein